MMLKADQEVLRIFKSVLYRSSFYAVAGYFISLYIEKLIMAVTAIIIGYVTTIGYDNVIILTNPNKWNQESVLMIYLLPYLILAILLVWLFIDIERHIFNPAYKRIFAHWIIFFIAFRALGMLSAHLYRETGIYHAFNWLYMDWKFAILIGIVGLVLFFLSGVRLLNLIFFLSGAYNNNSQVIGSERLVYSAILAPWLAVICVSSFYYLPGFPRDEMIGLLVLSLPFAYAYFRHKKLKPDFLPSRIIVGDKFSPFLMCIILLSVLVIVRIVLGIGLTFNG